MKKKSIVGRLAVLAMILTLVTTSLTAGTLAKYTQSLLATGTGVVAVWDNTLKINKQATSGTFDLSDTILTDDKTSRVASGRIAPGTKGQIEVGVDVEGSEVDVACLVQVMLLDDSEAAGENIKWKWGQAPGNTTPVSMTSGRGTWQNVATEEFRRASDSGASANVVYYLYWEWPFDDENGSGTGDDYDIDDGTPSSGAANGKDLKIDIRVTLTQINPTTPIT